LKRAEKDLTNLRKVAAARIINWTEPGAKLVTCAEDVIEQLPTPVRAALTQAMQPETGQANLLVAASLNPSEKKLYEMLRSDEPQPIDDIL
jgi:hypothetical protein